jgi:signal transduction histidine kinase
MNLHEDHSAYHLICEAEKAAKMATRLTNQLLTFSKGRVPIKERFDMVKLLKETTSFNLTDSNVKHQITCSKEKLAVNADKGQIEQVISNLVINANQAMPNGGTLFIDLKEVTLQNKNSLNLQPGNYAKLTIRDEGCVISPEIIHHIFDPYFTTKKTGNGIGLATVYSIVDKHKGHIEVSSTLEKGSIFTIHILASQQSTSPEKNANSP